MLDEKQKAEFVREGLRHYPDARGTVDYFQTTIQDAIFAAFEGRVWKHFQPTRGPLGELQIAKAVGPVDRFIHAYLAGTLATRNTGSDKVWLTLGLYWRPAARPGSPVVAACWANVDRGGSVPFVDVPARPPTVLLGPMSRRTERRLLIEPGPEFDVLEDFAVLLDCADEALCPRPSDVGSAI